MKNTEKLTLLKEQIFDTNNRHCFIERERFLQSYPTDNKADVHYYPRLLSDLLDSVSTPVRECDIFVGRVVEGSAEEFAVCPNRLLFAKGHLTPNYERLLRLGYSGILAQIRENAAQLGTAESQVYYDNARICVEAIRRFALRYAQAAKAAGNLRAYEALCRVPYEPAYDLFSALQGMWLVHMIASCYVGSRDYGFGYMDEYLYPFFLQEKRSGATDREIEEMLAGFLIKTNEICGRATHNYQQKPVLSQASKQYVLLDAGRANGLSERILAAAAINCMAQPEITVVLTKNTPSDFKEKVFDAMARLTDKLQVYNGDLLKDFLRSKALPEALADRPAFTACCTADIYFNSCREEFYLPSVQIFCQTLFENHFSTKEALLSAYGAAITDAAEQYILSTRTLEPDFVRCAFVLDCLLLGACNEKCAYPPMALDYRAKNIFLTGLATLGDSLAALDTLVFRGNMSYDTFVDAVKKDFRQAEALLTQIKALPKFGNDTPVDTYTAQMADLLIDAVEQAAHLENEIILPSFYSLQRENEWADQTPATPDGKRAGVAFSENQSPTYGADKNGVTALLNSLSKVPFGRTAAGGVNLTFSATVAPNILSALAQTYFQQGGLHMGITVLDRATLLDAMAHPEKHPTLTVRLYGFSEYFISLPLWQQEAVLNRTAY